MIEFKKGREIQSRGRALHNVNNEVLAVKTGKQNKLHVISCAKIVEEHLSNYRR